MVDAALSRATVDETGTATELELGALASVGDGEGSEEVHVGRSPCLRLKLAKMQQGLRTRERGENYWHMCWHEEPSWDLPY